MLPSWRCGACTHSMCVRELQYDWRYIVKKSTVYSRQTHTHKNRATLLFLRQEITTADCVDIMLIVNPPLHWNVKILLLQVIRCWLLCTGFFNIKFVVHWLLNIECGYMLLSLAVTPHIICAALLFYFNSQGFQSGLAAQRTRYQDGKCCLCWHWARSHI